MNTKKVSKQTWNVPIIVFIIFTLCIFLLYIQLGYLTFSTKIYGKNMSEFAKTRNTVSKTVTASRGNIYDIEGNALAMNVSSYTVIAYLSDKRPEYVKNVDQTATALATVLGTDVNELKDMLNKGIADKKYQIELGAKAKGITQLKKEEIESLELKGIDFIESKKRYYPNGRFASYIVGYAKEKNVEVYNEETEKKEEKIEISGELGIEAKYNDLLKGTDGYTEYQQDRYGYKISGTKEINIEADDGYDVYLTVDSSIQRFIEAAIEDSTNKYHPEWMQINVMDAKTGAILGSGSSPSFDPNLRDITNYENPLVTYLYEPGSTMKTYTYMCAIDNAKYNGADTYQSGNILIGDAIVNDWNKYGWGTINYDKGYEYSSNVGIANLMTKYLSAGELKSCLTKYGFGKKTGIELTREQEGDISFKYSIEVVNAGFGQGITTTAVQQLQAASIIANNGKMVTPYIVDKIINPNDKTIYYKGKKVKSDQIVKNTTISKMKELMYNAIHGTDPGTAAKSYNIEGIDLIGKSGTAQIYNSSGTGYSSGVNDYVFSFIGMYPKDEPEIIIYTAMKKPQSGASVGLVEATKSVIKSVAKYKNIYTNITQTTNKSYKISSYANKSTEDIKKTLQNNGITPIIIGSGKKIIEQYPTINSTVLSNNKVVLLTNSNDYKMPNMIGFSKLEATKIAKLLNLDIETDGYGYVNGQSIPEGTNLNEQTKLKVTLNSKLINKEV